MNLPAILVNTMDRLTDKRNNANFNPKAVTLQKDIVYNSSHAKDCCLDIYRRIGDTSTLPVIVNIHGGSFVASDKHYRRGCAARFANAGYAVLNINYPLAPKCRYKEILAATYGVFGFIRDHATDYALDTDKVIVMGDSAGAYLATGLCALATNPDCRSLFCVEFYGITPIAAVLYSGVYAPMLLMNEKMMLNQQFAIGKALYGIKNRRELAAFKELPLTDLRNHIGVNFPPVFLSHTDFDNMCPRQGEQMLEALRSIAIPTWEFHAKRIPCQHDWQLSPSKPSLAVIDATLAFLAERLAGKTSDAYFEI